MSILKLKFLKLIFKSFFNAVKICFNTIFGVFCPFYLIFIAIFALFAARLVSRSVAFSIFSFLFSFIFHFSHIKTL